MSVGFVSQVAKSVPFDNATNSFTSTEVQSALEELHTLILATQANNRIYAKFSHDGNSSSGRWLAHGPNIPSNETSYVVAETCKLRTVTMAAAASATTTATIYKNGVSAQTISLAAQTVNRVASLNISFAVNDLVSVKITSGSTSKPIVGLYFEVTI